MGDNWPRAHKQTKYYQAQAKLLHRAVDSMKKITKNNPKRGNNNKKYLTFKANKINKNNNNKKEEE